MKWGRKKKKILASFGGGRSLSVEGSTISGRAQREIPMRGRRKKSIVLKEGRKRRDIQLSYTMRERPGCILFRKKGGGRDQISSGRKKRGKKKWKISSSFGTKRRGKVFKSQRKMEFAHLKRGGCTFFGKE